VLEIRLFGGETIRADTVARFLATFAPHGADPRSIAPDTAWPKRLSWCPAVRADAES